MPKDFCDGILCGALAVKSQRPALNRGERHRMNRSFVFFNDSITESYSKKSYVIIQQCVYVFIVGHVWRISRVDTFRPKGRGYDSRSRRHVGTLGKSFTHSCLWRFRVKFRHSIRAVSGAPLSSSGLEEALLK